MIIGVDIDDVTIDLNTALQDWHNRKYETNLQRQDITDYDLWNVWRCKKEEAIRRVHEFYQSFRFTETKPVEGAQQGIAQLTRFDKAVSITSRPSHMRDKTWDQIHRYFPNKFSGLYLTNTYSLKGKTKTKSEICREIGVTLMIEDAPKTIMECHKSGLDVIVLNCPWNENVSFPEEVRRTKNWREIVEAVEEMRG